MSHIVVFWPISSKQTIEKNKEQRFSIVNYCSCINMYYTSSNNILRLLRWPCFFIVCHLFQGKIDLLKDAVNEWNLRILRVDQSFADVYTCIKDNKEELYVITLKINGKRI